MVNYPITSLVCFAVTYYLFQFHSDTSGLFKAGVVAPVGILTGLALYPFARAIWLVADHILHPLSQEDYWDPTEKQSSSSDKT